MNNQNSMMMRDQRLIGNKRKEKEPSGKNKFPIGMRVLLVDHDDDFRERVLKNLLQQCKYKVTTMDLARKALIMLRENRNNFDLVITEAEMPDMNVLKLLELVEIEFNIPVIVVSAKSDHKLVKKVIELGACDYLLKPVRIEELRNIWQHVLRRKYPHLIMKPSISGAILQENQSAQGLINGGNSDLYRMLNENNDADGSDDNEELSNHKRARIVWSMDLHNRFVAAVNQLGTEKAVPKKILDIMNVEGLTRENIASHLQKYRIYLKRESNAPTEQAALCPAFGGSPSYLHMTPSERNRALGGPGRLPYYTLPQLSTGVPFGSQLSGVPHLSSESSEPQSSNLVQPSRPSSSNSLQTSQSKPSNLIQSSQLSPSNLINQSSDNGSSAGKMQASVLSPNKTSGLVQGTPSFTPSSNSLDQSQERNSASQIGELNSASETTSFVVPNNFPGKNVTIDGPNNSLPDVSNNLLESPRSIPFMAKFGNQSAITPLKKEPSNIGIGGSSLNVMDHGTSNESWQNFYQFPELISTPMLLTGDFSQNQPSPNNLTNEFCFTSTISEDSQGDNIQEQSGFITNQAENVNFASGHKWEDDNPNSDNNFTNFQSLTPAYGDGSNLFLGFGQYCMGVFDPNLINQPNAAPKPAQQNEVGDFGMETGMSANDVYVPTQSQTQENYVPNGIDSIDEILNAIVKLGQDTSLYAGDDFNFNMYNF